MSFELTTNQQVEITLAVQDDYGNACAVDGVPVWSSTDDTVVALFPAADGLSALAVSQAVGSATISVSADADLGAGVVAIGGSLDIDVVAAQASNVVLTPGTPTDKPVVQPVTP